MLQKSNLLLQIYEVSPTLTSNAASYLVMQFYQLTIGSYFFLELDSKQNNQHKNQQKSYLMIWTNFYSA